MEAFEPMNESKGSLARPKRPLSAFNLFYRFKRRHVADAVAHGMTSREAIVSLIEVAPGLERCSPNVNQDASPVELEVVRRHCIREDLVNNLLPRETRDRAHRRDQDRMNGTMGFVELGGVMRESWKGCDEFAKEVFRELADEGRALYRQRMKDWNDATSRELVLRELEAKKAAKEFAKQASLKQPSCKQTSTKQSSAKLTNECSGDEREPRGLIMKDSLSQDGSVNDHTATQPSANEGQPAITCSDPAPALKGSQFCGGSELSDMAGAESGPMRKRFKVENDEAPRPSNSNETHPMSLLLKQPTPSESRGMPLNNTSGVPPSDLRETSKDRSAFQERISMRGESVRSNGTSPNDLPNVPVDRGSIFQGGEPSRSFSLPGQDASSGSNRGSPNDPRNSLVNHGPFQANEPPVGLQNEVEKRTKARVRELEAQLAANRPPFQASGPPGSCQNEEEGRPKARVRELEAQLAAERLQARVRELEAQLSAERLQARVRELEVQLTRQRANEDWLTRQVGSFSRNHGTAGAVGGLLTAQDGHLPLLSTILRMGEARNNPPAVQSAIHFSSNGTSNKRLRPN